MRCRERDVSEKIRKQSGPDDTRSIEPAQMK